MKAIVCEEDAAKGPSGAIEFRTIPGETSPAGIAFRCPCGCGAHSWLPINEPGETFGWDWNGSLEAPTLTPSVLNPCRWHGFLTNGEWRTC